MNRLKKDIGLADRLSVPFEIKQIQEDANGFFRFKGLASTFGNVDFGGDVMQPNAFKNTLLELRQNATSIPDSPSELKILPVLWQHNMDEPIGSFVSVNVTDRGLEVEGILPKNDSLVSGRVIPQMRVGSVGEMSIGYITKQSSRDENGNRLLEEVELFEVSLVTIAMNPKATVTDMKAKTSFKDFPLAARDKKWNADSALDRVKKFTNSESDPSNQYKDAFLYYDSNKEDEFDGYKTLIADVINDKLTIVPKAIFAAAAEIRTIDIDESKKSSIISNIDKYYDKLGLDSPFQEKSCFRLDDLDCMNERTLEKCLKKGVILPGSVARTIVSFIKTSKRDAEEAEKRDADQSNNKTIDNLKKINQLFE